MREIKFRGKTLSGKWVYGYYVGKVTIIPFEDVNYDLGFIDTSPCYEVIPDTIGQFTGMHDKNGEEIYEGDIVERFQPMPHYRNGVYYDGCAIYGVVRYIDSGFYILSDKQAYELSRNFDMWVQGNIHDNAELLNK